MSELVNFPKGVLYITILNHLLFLTFNNFLTIKMHHLRNRVIIVRVLSGFKVNRGLLY